MNYYILLYNIRMMFLLREVNDRIQYVGTVGYAKQDGIIESSYERYNTRLNTTANLADWFTIQSNIAYINDVSKRARGLVMLIIMHRVHFLIYRLNIRMEPGRSILHPRTLYV